MIRSRLVGLSLGAALAAAGLSVPAPASAATPCPAGTPLEGDVDGDGLAELVVGSRPFTTTSGAGRHWVQPGDGSPATFVEGGALELGDLNGDRCADAVLHDGGHVPRLQAVLGTPDGLDLDGATDLPVPQVADLTSDDRELQLEAATLRHDGTSQVVVAGVHTFEEGSERYGGYVDVLTLGPDLEVTDTQVMSFPGVEGDIVGFGVLATSGSTVAVGAPSETVGGHARAGAVRLYTPDADDPTRLVRRRTLTQDSAGVPGSAETSDRFGASLAMRDGRLAIGAPGEADGRIARVGLVQPLVWHQATGTYTAYRAVTQDTSGVPGSNERDDAFGSHLAIGRGLTAAGSYDVVIGADEAYGSLAHAGSVTVANLTKALFRTYTQATAGVPGNPQAGDEFERVGVLRSSGPVDTVLIGAPGEDSGGVDGVGRVVRSDGARLTASTPWATVPVPPDAPAGLLAWGLSVGAHG